MALKIKTTNIESTALTSLTVPKITGVSYPNGATAANPAGGETITVTGNWGTATDNPTIATAKGWSVTG